MSSGKGLNLASLRRVRGLWQDKVQRLTLAELQALSSANGGAPNRLEVAQRTHWELKVRIAHRLRDFLFLPYKVMAHPCIRSLYERYVTAYHLHEDFATVDSPAKAAEYWKALARTFEEHRHVTQLLGHSRSQLIRLDPDLAPILDGFLDRFFVSRIGTHLLGSHFLTLGPVPQGARKPAGVAMGVLQPTSPSGFVRDLSASLARLGHGCHVPVEVEDAMGTSILYIPAHLRVLLREILHNAMTATARLALEQGCDPVPVHVRVNRGQCGVFITVSDQGGGIPDLERVWNWGDHGSANGVPPDGGSDGDLEWSSTAAEQPRMAFLPLGFGLPFARLTARYFGGDVQLQTLVGYGTSAYVHIPELQQVEVGEEC